MSAEEVPYIFRPYTKDDIPFIQSSWGNSYYDGVNGHKLLTPEEFHDHHRPIRETILNRSSVAVIVCVSRTDENLIIGYVIVEKPTISRGLILHYIYVKQAFKGERIASELLKRAVKERPVLFTHSTIASGRIISKYKATNRVDLHRFLAAPHLI